MVEQKAAFWQVWLQHRATNAAWQPVGMAYLDLKDGSILAGSKREKV
jgi:hypothetical protein